nr:unnamed protein product [Digitaria exilis]
MSDPFSPSAASDSCSPSTPSRTGRPLTSSLSPSYRGARFAGAIVLLPCDSWRKMSRADASTAQTPRCSGCRLRWNTRGGGCVPGPNGVRSAGGGV